MPPSPTDIIQSFWLRLWRESGGDGRTIWRGTIWHEQQGSEETAVAVPSPEVAFEFVRTRLRQSSAGTDGQADEPGLDSSSPRSPDSNWPRRHWRKMVFWRRPR
jgi:hypothetical protein